jgi:CheY-like chemotaxis protein
MLAYWSMDPSVAASGRAGLDELQRAAAAQTPYRLILLDCMMPELDGFAVAQQVRRRPDLAATPIVMLTSSGQLGDIARCREIGIDDYLTKPINQSELLASMLRALGSRPGLPLAASAPAAADAPHLRILLVEDNAVNQKLGQRLLQRLGHDVTLADDGAQALAVLCDDQFNAVLMDVQMPGMDGFEATAAIRARERAQGGHVPIIAMTAHAMKGDRERCLAAGMDDYVTKPIDAAGLRAALERAVPSVGGDRGSCAVHGADVAAPHTAPPDVPPSGLQGR